MTNLAIAVANIAFWPIVQLSVSALFARIPNSFFASDDFLTHPRTFDASLRFYRSLNVHQWKKLLPDGASIVGAKPKHVNPYSPDEVSSFLIETRRGEIAHWIQLTCVAICWAWNPLWAALVMTAYAVSANLPCILAQRYNRILLGRRTSSEASRFPQHDGPSSRELGTEQHRPPKII
jgi:glycosyl-4,4'-diaponeurosporenoate acyltransferase